MMVSAHFTEPEHLTIETGERRDLTSAEGDVVELHAARVAALATCGKRKRRELGRGAVICAVVTM